jgi:CRP-like cAMP-binding protein
MGAPKRTVNMSVSPLTEQMAERLKRVEFFAHFPEQLLLEIAEITEVVRFEGGEEILKKNQYNSSLYLLISGRVAVHVDGGKVAELSHFGDLLGEMSVIQGRPCGATIQAEESVELFRIGLSQIAQFLPANQERLHHTLFRVYASVLADKLHATNQKAKHIERMNSQLETTKIELELAKSKLEKKVEERTKDLNAKTQDLILSHAKLETQNIELHASHKKLEELYSTKKATFSKLEELYKEHLIPLKITLNELEVKIPAKSRSEVKKAGKEVLDVISMLEPITSVFRKEQAMESQKVLLVESQKKQQILAKMALGGTGALLTIVSTAEEAIEVVKKQTFDIIFIDEALFDFCERVPELCPTSEVVLMTGESVPNYIHKLKTLSYMPNIISRNAEDRTFTMKNIVTSVSKLTSKDVFGIDKYLSWGVEIHEAEVISSGRRDELVQKTDDYFAELGIRKSNRDRSRLVLEELLMNAIYDAPTDESGKALYNHLERNQDIELEEKHHAKMRFATDGMLMAVSVEDPNGSLKGEIILNYLESCYSGQVGQLQKDKGGAGRGLHQIIENSDLVVFNIRPGISTEVIALFNVEQKGTIEKEPSFHLFIQ